MIIVSSCMSRQTVNHNWAIDNTNLPTRKYSTVFKCGIFHQIYTKNSIKYSRMIIQCWPNLVSNALYWINLCIFCDTGAVSMCGRGKPHPIHHQRTAEPRSGSSLGGSQQPRRCWGALRTQVQQPVCCWQLLWGCQSGSQCAKGAQYFSINKSLSLSKQKCKISSTCLYLLQNYWITIYYRNLF